MFDKLEWPDDYISLLAVGVIGQCIAYRMAIVLKRDRIRSILRTLNLFSPVFYGMLLGVLHLYGREILFRLTVEQWTTLGILSMTWLLWHADFFTETHGRVPMLSIDRTLIVAIAIAGPIIIFLNMRFGPRELINFTIVHSKLASFAGLKIASWIVDWTIVKLFLSVTIIFALELRFILKYLIAVEKSTKGSK